MSLHITTDVETRAVVLVSRGDRHEWVNPDEIDGFLTLIDENRDGTHTLTLGCLVLDRHNFEQIRDTAIKEINR